MTAFLRLIDHLIWRLQLLLLGCPACGRHREHRTYCVLRPR